MRWGEQGEDWVTTSVDVTVTEKSEVRLSNHTKWHYNKIKTRAGLVYIIVLLSVSMMQKIVTFTLSCKAKRQYLLFTAFWLCTAVLMSLNLKKY